MSTLLLNLLDAVAEFERSLTRERQAEGIALAKTRNVYKGRAAVLRHEQSEEAGQKRSGSVPVARIARDLGCSRQTLYSALAGSGVYSSLSEARPNGPGGAKVRPF